MTKTGTKIIEFWVVTPGEGSERKIVEFGNAQGPADVDNILSQFPRIEVANAYLGKAMPPMGNPRAEKIARESLVNFHVLFAAFVTSATKRTIIGSHNTDLVWPKFDENGALFVAAGDPLSSLTAEQARKKFCTAIYEIASGIREVEELTQARALAAVEDRLKAGKAAIKLAAERAKQRGRNN